MEEFFAERKDEAHCRTECQREYDLDQRLENYGYTDGMSPASAVLKPRQTIADAGITWHMNMLNIKRRR